MNVSRVTPHVVRIEWELPIPVCMWAIEHDDGYAVVDAGLSIRNAVTALSDAGFNGSPSHILLTHGHADHTGGARKLIEKWSAPVVTSQEEAPYVTGEKRYLQAASGVRQRAVLQAFSLLGTLEGPDISVDGVVEEGDVLAGLEVLSLPGHTPGQIGFLHREDRVVVVGDSVFNFFGVSGNDPFPGIDLDLRMARESLARLAELDVDLLLPSHGPPLRPDRLEVLCRA